MNTPFTIEDAYQLDGLDPLSAFRERFYQPGGSLIYLDGNSLGMMPQKTRKHMRYVVEEEWGERLIRGWNERWWNLSRNLSRKLAQLVGAGRDEIILTDSTSVNLYKLAWAALNHLSNRNRIVTDVFNFPSDHYILQGVASQFSPGKEIVLAPSDDGIHINTGKLKSLITEDTALVCLSLVAFHNAFMYDLEEITRAAHERGALVLWDLSHAVGAFPIDLSGTSVDLAVGCTYKYLNGGPGSPAFLYIRKALIPQLTNPIQGWIGTARPFSFSRRYEQPGNILGWQTGSPTILSLTPLDVSLGITQEAGIERLRAKSLKQTGFLIDLAKAYLAEFDVRIATPEDPQQRGSHVSLRHPEAYRITQALIHPPKGKPVVIPDFRTPDLVRLGVAPLYNTFEELYRAIRRIGEILRDQEYLHFPESKKAVT